MAQQNHPVFVQTFADKLSHLDAVLRHAVDRHVAWLPFIPAKGFTRAALVPLDDCEILLPSAKRQSEWYVGGTGAPVQHEHDRVAAVFPPDLDPLLDAAYLDEHALLDPVLRVDSKRCGVPMLTDRAICQSTDKSD